MSPTSGNPETALAPRRAPIARRDGLTLPATIARAGERASRRFLEYFAAEVRNPHTRRAYAAAAGRFLAWCDARGLALEHLEPVLVAAYVEELGRELGPASVKQHLAALRRLFDYLVVGQVLPANPAAAVRGPRLVIRTGKTPVLEPEEVRTLLASIIGEDLGALRDRARRSRWRMQEVSHRVGRGADARRLATPRQPRWQSDKALLSRLYSR
jgi:integrase/recombinase XerC